MAIWRLERTGGAGYDEYDSLIIRAGSEEEARGLAKDRYFGFSSSTLVDCEYVEPEGETEVIHESFCAG